MMKISTISLFIALAITIFGAIYTRDIGICIMSGLFGIGLAISEKEQGERQ